MARARAAKISIDDLQAQFNALRQEMIIKFNHLKMDHDALKHSIQEIKTPIDRQSIGQKAFARVLRLEDDYGRLIKGVKRRVRK